MNAHRNSSRVFIFNGSKEVGVIQKVVDPPHASRLNRNIIFRVFLNLQYLFRKKAENSKKTVTFLFIILPLNVYALALQFPYDKIEKVNKFTVGVG